MKITDVKVIPLEIPAKEIPSISISSMGPSGGMGRPGSKYHVLVKVFTDEGIIGYGEPWRIPPGAVSSLIKEALKPLLIGENPMHIERLWDLMYRATCRFGRTRLTMHCISGVEIALWDIIGKYRNLPVYEMLGGLCRDKIRAYASFPFYEAIKDATTMAYRFVEEGYTAIKLHPFNMVKAVGEAKAVRKVIGDNIDLMVDVGGACTPRQAVEKAKELEQYNVMFLEEPIWPTNDYDGLAYVRDRSNIPIAAGEDECTHYGFRELITKGAVDIVQPDVTKSGGLLECRKILALTEAWNLRLITHSYCYGPGIAATLQFALSNMKSEYIEINPLPLEASFIWPPLQPEKGFITAPDGPGLGIEIDEDVVKKYPYSV